jgi:deoxyribonuclease-4
MNIGAHVRGGGKLVPSLEAGVEIGATSIQIFTQSPRMWKPSQYAPEVLTNFREAQASHPSVRNTFCHATYLINLASPDRALYERSVECLISNLSTSRGMGSSGVVLHVGSHLGAGFETVVQQIAEAFERALDTAEKAPPGVADCPILIENAAGTGGTVGRSLDEIQALIDATGRDERLGLCIDTQHLWASGVDFSTVAGANALIDDIDRRIGIDRLRCFHLNDSKIELGGNRDRHANIDEGTIGTKGLAPLVGHPLIRDLPLLLEVPGSGEGPRAEDVVAARKIVEAGIKLYGASSSSSTAAKKVSVKKESTTMENVTNEGNGDATNDATPESMLDAMEVPETIAVVKEIVVQEIEVIKEELPKQIAKVTKTAKKKIAKAKKTATKKIATAKKTVKAKSAAGKKSAAKKGTAAKKTVAKKGATAKKSTAKKGASVKTSATKKGASVKKSAAKKSAAVKKSAAKKASGAKKNATKKVASAKKTAKKTRAAVKKSVTKKAASAKKTAKKSAAKKTTKKSAAKKTTKKTVAKKSAKKSAAKKTAKKSTAKR